MDVICPKCKSRYIVNQRHLTPNGRDVTCSRCNHRFHVQLEGAGGAARPRQTLARVPAERGPSPAASKRGESPASGTLDRERSGSASNPHRDTRPPWTIRRISGDSLTFQDLSTLREWIHTGAVGRNDEISRSGEQWKQLGDIPELGVLFTAAEASAKRSAAEEAATIMAASPLPAEIEPALPEHGARPVRKTPQKQDAVSSQKIVTSAPASSAAGKTSRGTFGSERTIGPLFQRSTPGGESSPGLDRALRATSAAWERSASPSERFDRVEFERSSSGGRRWIVFLMLIGVGALIGWSVDPVRRAKVIGLFGFFAGDRVLVDSAADARPTGVPPTKASERRPADAAADPPPPAPDRGATPRRRATPRRQIAKAQPVPDASRPDVAPSVARDAAPTDAQPGGGDGSDASADSKAAMAAKTSGVERAAPRRTYESLVQAGHKESERGRTMRALALYQAALRLNPGGIEATTGLAYCDLDLERFSSALRHFRKVLRIAPAYGDAIIGTAEAYLTMGDSVRALERYRAYLRIHPDGPKAALARRNIRDLSDETPPPSTTNGISPSEVAD